MALRGDSRMQKYQQLHGHEAYAICSISAAAWIVFFVGHSAGPTIGLYNFHVDQWTTGVPLEIPNGTKRDLWNKSVLTDMFMFKKATEPLVHYPSRPVPNRGSLHQTATDQRTLLSCSSLEGRFRIHTSVTR